MGECQIKRLEVDLASQMEIASQMQLAYHYQDWQCQYQYVAGGKLRPCDLSVTYLEVC